jgi:hypothetical protein
VIYPITFERNYPSPYISILHFTLIILSNTFIPNEFRVYTTEITHVILNENLKKTKSGVKFIRISITFFRYLCDYEVSNRYQKNPKLSPSFDEWTQ